MPARTITNPDSLYFDALLAAINSADDYIYIAMFLMKSSYVGETRARQILEALGVQECVALDYPRFTPDVAEENYDTGLELSAAGCSVRFAPSNLTMHTKLVLIDLTQVFIGSHNITRGALSFNKELTVGSNTRDMCCRRLAGHYRRISPFVTSPATSSSWTFEIVRNCL